MGLTNSQVQSGAYALILAEENGPRRIPIIVGSSEAQSIAIEMESITPPRPLTHDLFITTLAELHVILKEVFIYKFEEGVFFSHLILDNQGQELVIDSRTSDAIALAMRAHADIYTTEEIIRESGIVIDERKAEDVPEEEYLLPDIDLEPEEFSIDDFKDPEALRLFLMKIKNERLLALLDEAIANENYEDAKVYQDELKRRKQEREGE